MGTDDRKLRALHTTPAPAKADAAEVAETGAPRPDKNALDASTRAFIEKYRPALDELAQ